MKSLHSQTLVHAPAATKVRLSILATAMADALGAPAEFRRRLPLKPITKMLKNGNFGLPAGVWTDDTSMTLCLAHSLTRKLGFDALDQLDAYLAWYEDGVLSAVGRCFDIGATVREALRLHRKDRDTGIDKIKQRLDDDDVYAGNGSLMRVLPIGLAYWHNEARAREFARRSSATTHPCEMCQEACEVWTGAIVRILQASHERREYTKLDLLRYFASFPHENKALRNALACQDPESGVEMHFHEHHPIIRLVESTSKYVPTDRNPLCLPRAEDLPSSGFVLHSLVAALYCFFSTETFEQGAIAAANLGDDADTVAAIYGGLAGCWYASDAENNAFWSPRVQEWNSGLVAKDVLEKVTNDFNSFVESMEEE